MEPSFFARDTATVARDLLGCRLVDGDVVGRIVETEAYYGADDPASHAASGPTERNRVMFGPPGRAYVYVCYGIHHMLNATTERAGTPGAVLIRAVEPVAGLDQMRERRRVDERTALCDGPGKLCEAFGVSTADGGTRLTDGALRIERGESPASIARTPRVGISRAVDRELRFIVEGSEYVSGGPVGG